MKILPRNIDAFVRKPAPEAAAILLYGPDEGLVRERLDLLTKTAVADIRDPFNVAEIPADRLSENPALLLDEAQSISMLGGRRVVRVRGASDKITAAARDALAALKPGDNLVLLEAGELPPRSSLRALFENADNGAAIPCYVEDARDLGRVIADALKSAGISASSDAVSHMAAHVVGDRAVARAEVEKLLTYLGPGAKAASLEDVVASVGNSAALSLDDLSKYIAAGDFAAADKILQHVLSEGIPAVTVLRTLQSHFLRLHATKARVQKGESAEEAIRKLRPPLFFKAKPSFELQLTNWSLLQVEQALSLLATVEARCKQTASEPATLCSRALLTLSQMSARALGMRRRA